MYRHIEFVLKNLSRGFDPVNLSLSTALYEETLQEKTLICWPLASS